MLFFFHFIHKNKFCLAKHHSPQIILHKNMFPVLNFQVTWEHYIVVTFLSISFFKKTLSMSKFDTLPKKLLPWVCQALCQMIIILYFQSYLFSGFDQVWEVLRVWYNFPICIFRCMVVLRPHNFRSMLKNKVHGYEEKSNRGERNKNKQRMILKLMITHG